MTFTIDQSSIDVNIPISQFPYDTLDRLTIGYAFNAVTNGLRKQLPQSTFVLNSARDSAGRYFAQVGISTGEVLDVKASDIWTDWQKDTIVFGVRWITAQVQVPSVLYARQRQMMPNEDARDVIQYVLRQG